MSGICGFLRLDGRPVQRHELDAMLVPMQRRGPDGRHTLLDGPLGAGHALFATTPEARAIQQPWTDPVTGCVVVADSRLDDRAPLARTLGIEGRHPDLIGDAELILAAWQRWGEQCAERLTGDFAFALWDPRTCTLHCARDIMGVRPLYVHFAPGRLFAFASDTYSLLALPDVPHELNEARVADALVDIYEGIDRRITFHVGIERLPPATSLTLRNGRLEEREYWNPLQHQPTLPNSEAEWIEATRHVLDVAVRRRLRGGPSAAMVSGGLDSSSVAALAHRQRQQAGLAPLATYSAIDSRTHNRETTAIEAMLAAFDFDATQVDLAHPERFMAEVREQHEAVREPFDAGMTLLSAIYATAHANGVRVMLDGMPGDALYSASGYLGRLIRQGHWSIAWREAVALHRAEARSHQRARAILSLTGALLPASGRPLLDSWRRHRFYHATALRYAPVTARFASDVDLRSRNRAFFANLDNTRLTDPARGGESILTAAHIAAATERYGRIAAHHGIEPRHPFLDRDVIELHAWMPQRLRMRDGRHKWALRMAVDSLLPPSVAWREDKDHLGSRFNSVAYSDWRLAAGGCATPTILLQRAVPAPELGWLWNATRPPTEHIPPRLGSALRVAQWLAQLPNGAMNSP